MTWLHLTKCILTEFAETTRVARAQTLSYEDRLWRLHLWRCVRNREYATDHRKRPDVRARIRTRYMRPDVKERANANARRRLMDPAKRAARNARNAAWMRTKYRACASAQEGK